MMAILMSVLLGWLCIFSGTYAPAAQPSAQPMMVAEEAQEAPAANDAREARLLNMLSLNRVFGDDIYDTEILLEEAAARLIGSAEEDPETGFYFADRAMVEALVYNLYGRAASAAELDYSGFPQKEGKVLILPKGGADIEHSIVDVSEEENGVLRVVSRAEIRPHDAASYVTLAVTKFAPASASAFGYVIISAELVA